MKITKFVTIGLPPRKPTTKRKYIIDHNRVNSDKCEIKPTNTLHQTKLLSKELSSSNNQKRNGNKSEVRLSISSSNFMDSKRQSIKSNPSANIQSKPMGDTEVCFEAEEIDSIDHKPLAFVTKKSQETLLEESKKKYSSQRVTPKYLQKNVRFLKQNISPRGEDFNESSECGVEITDESIEEKSNHIKPTARSNTTEDNTPGCSEHQRESNSFSEKEQIGPQSFIAHKLLGKGSFGEVYLVEKINTKKLYAMKVVSKTTIMSQNLIKYVISERKVLSNADHPFIVKLHYAFQTSAKLFLVLDYCPGGDLAIQLRKEKKFTEERAKIYIMEILLALEYLHNKGIIFRDLKPDNVVIDKNGHALLTDFGLSKEGVYDNFGAKSFCGSFAYLAPEMIKKTGHGKPVDWYLLGVLLYEMLVGIPPYYSPDK